MAMSTFWQISKATRSDGFDLHTVTVVEHGAVSTQRPIY